MSARPGFIAVALAIVTLCSVLGATKGPLPNPQQLDYDIIREGSKIGEHHIAIDRRPDVTIVDASTNIAVRVMFVTAYRLTSAAREIWAGDQLRSFKSQTDDNGTTKSVVLDERDGRFAIRAGLKQTVSAEKSIVPASFWNPALIGRTLVFDTETGRIANVTVKDMGWETVGVRGTPTRAHHFNIAGGMQRDVWFDSEGRPVRFQLRGTDNSLITSQLQ
jgi:hypothetical protein